MSCPPRVLAALRRAADARPTRRPRPERGRPRRTGALALRRRLPGGALPPRRPDPAQRARAAGAAGHGRRRRRGEHRRRAAGDAGPLAAAGRLPGLGGAGGRTDAGDRRRAVRAGRPSAAVPRRWPPRRRWRSATRGSWSPRWGASRPAAALRLRRLRAGAERDAGRGRARRSAWSWEFGDSAGRPGYDGGAGRGRDRARCRTDLDAFDEAEQAVLENHGYLLAEAAAARERAGGGVERPDGRARRIPNWMDEARGSRVRARRASRRLHAGRGGQHWPRRPALRAR